MISQNSVKSESAFFEGIGWKVRLQQKNTNYFLTLAKEIVVGNALKRGDDILYYLVESNGRKGILMFLDGKERESGNKVKINRITFLVKK